MDWRQSLLKSPLVHFDLFSDLKTNKIRFNALISMKIFKNKSFPTLCVKRFTRKSKEPEGTRFLKDFQIQYNILVKIFSQTILNRILITIWNILRNKFRSLFSLIFCPLRAFLCWIKDILVFIKILDRIWQWIDSKVSKPLMNLMLRFWYFCYTTLVVITWL